MTPPRFYFCLEIQYYSYKLICFTYCFSVNRAIMSEIYYKVMYQKIILKTNLLNIYIIISLLYLISTLNNCTLVHLYIVQCTLVHLYNLESWCMFEGVSPE